MRRFFADPSLLDRELMVIEGEEAKHMARVLRMQVGDAVIVMDGEGCEAPAVIDAIDARTVILRKKGGKRPSPTEPKLSVTLFQALPKGDKMDLIVQKCVELGISRVIPVRTKNCVAKVAPGADAAKKQQRWQRIALEAAKQSGRGRIPAVSEPLDFAQALKEWQAAQSRILLYEEEHRTALSEAVALIGDVNDTALFVGAEGGLTPEEAAALSENGISASLGPRILRTETAGMAALAVLMAMKGEMAPTLQETDE